MPATDQNQSLVLDTAKTSGPFVESIQSNLDSDASFYIKNVKQLTITASIPRDHFEKVLGVCTAITDLCVHDIVNREGPIRQVFDPVLLAVSQIPLQRLSIRATYLPPLWYILYKRGVTLPLTHLTLDVNTVPDAVSISLPFYTLHESDVTPSLTHLLLRFNPASKRELISILKPGEICDNVLRTSPPMVRVLALQIAEVERSFLQNEAQWKPDTTMPPGASDPRCVYVSAVNGGGVSSSAPSDDVWTFAESVIERRRNDAGAAEPDELNLSALSLDVEKERVELPPDLLRVIFERAVLGESEKTTGLSLVRVCKMAHGWIEPILYHSLMFDSQEKVLAFMDSIYLIKDAAFFAQHVKQLSLNVDIGVEHLERLLQLFTGVTDLCIKDNRNREGPVQASFNAIFINIANLPLKRLSIRSTYLPPLWSRLERGSLTLSITHLTLDINNVPDSVKLSAPFFIGKSTAPSLTHILVRINPSSAREITSIIMPGLICHNILSTAPHLLRVLAVQMTPEQLEALPKPGMFQSTRIPGAKDPRCVHVVGEAIAISSYAPEEAVWTLAEKEVERRMTELGEAGNLQQVNEGDVLDYIQRYQAEMYAMASTNGR
ncbi:hypothetical protein BDZ89DRAFT_1118973 [Hymenopellis radicata]|nr:hypothetical protein BDZ89DRAFT_1118973 [Hymenopellis radicata]